MTFSKLQQSILDRTKSQLFGPCGLAPGRTLIVALSAGLDSTMLAWALRHLEVPMVLAHAQFHLRGQDSLADQHFVEALARQWDLPLQVKTFERPEPGTHGKSGKPSLQMWARDMRRSWLGDLKSSVNAHAIATAHHADDQAETILMRFLAGSGIEGLGGIRPRHEGFIRPFLGIHKKELLEAADGLGLSWREDRSNAEATYWRNRLRLEVLPALEAMRKGSVGLLARSGERFAQTAVLYRAGLQAAEASIRLHPPTNQSGEAATRESWDLHRLRQHPAGALVLEQRLKAWGAERAQAAECWAQLTEPGRCTSGAHWKFPKGTLILDRHRLVFVSSKAAAAEGANQHEADALQALDLQPLPHPPFRFAHPAGRLRVLAMPGRKLRGEHALVHPASHSQHRKPGDARHGRPNPSDRIFMDAAALRQFQSKAAAADGSLVLRTWRPGDYFHPLPSGKKRSLKRYLTDRKVPSELKSKVLVLACGERIVWVPGWGLDRRIAARPGCDAWEWRWEALD